MSDYPVGIYLGPNDSSIAIWRKRNAEIIHYGDVRFIIPSFVSFIKNKILVGEAAKDQITKNPKNTIYGIREIIGQTFNEPEVQKFIKKVPFKIEKDSKTNKPKIIVEYLDKITSFYPEEIYAMIIQELINLSRNYIRSEINEAIITVPSYYNDSQRQAIIDSGKICGLNKVKIVNEDIAVCYAYKLDKFENEKNILVFNMRSNETNVTILHLNNSNFEVKATSRDDNLGGNLFDEELIKYCINEFKEETGIIIQKDSSAYRRLMIACEIGKSQLSYSLETQIDLDKLDLIVYISWDVFEEICRNLFDKIIPLIEKALNDSKLKKMKLIELY